MTLLKVFCDLQLGDRKVTLNHLTCVFCFGNLGVFFLGVVRNQAYTIQVANDPTSGSFLNPFSGGAGTVH